MTKVVYNFSQLSTKAVKQTHWGRYPFKVWNKDTRRSTYDFRSEYTLYSCLNVKELLARSRRHIWILGDSNGIQTLNDLVRKRTLNHLAKLAKWLSVRLQTKWLWVRISLLSLPKTLFYGVVIVSLNRHSSIGRKVVQISETDK